ncbi:MAG: energy transducer TonB [Bacteroidota bacterium]
MFRFLSIIFLFSLMSLVTFGQPEVPPPPPEEVFTIVEDMPRFPGCEQIGAGKAELKKCAEQEMLTFVYDNITYPDSAVTLGVEGMVVLNFIVDTDGSLLNPKIVRDIGGGCGDAALAMLEKMPKWIPGKHKGETVKVEFNLPVKFKLEDPLAQLYEIPVYEGLSIVFCEDFAGEFFNATDLNAWADSPYDMNNLCGFESSVRKLEVTYVEESGTERSLESEGELTGGMRDYFRNAQPGSAIRLIISIERAGLKGKIIKVLLVE